MASADAVVVDTLLEHVLTAERLANVTERVLTKARKAKDVTGVRERLERQLKDTETALGRLTAAIAAGADVPAIVQTIKAQDTHRQKLERQLAELS